MLAVPSSRITLGSCPEGTSGQGMSDTKALTLGPVIFVALMGNARNCRRLVVQIQPEMVKFSQRGCISNYFTSVKWSMCEKTLCSVLLFMLQANLQVQCCFESDNFKSGFHSE